METWTWSKNKKVFQQSCRETNGNIVFIYMLRDEKVKRYEKAALLSGYEIYCIVTSVNCHSKQKSKTKSKRKMAKKWSMERFYTNVEIVV